MARQPQMRMEKKGLLFFLFLFGFTAAALQIVYLRKFLSLFYGNELSIGLFMFSWLFWSALGSLVFGKIKRPQSYIPVHLFLFSLIIPVTSLYLQFFRLHAQPITGTLPDLFSTLKTAFGALFLFGLFSGGLFPLYTGLLDEAKKQGTAFSSARVYLWETLGSAFSGLLAGLFLIRFFSSQELIIGFALINFLSSLYFVSNFINKQRTVTVSIFAFIFFSELILFIQSDARLNNRLWKGLKIVDQRSSLYGELTLTALDGSQTLYQDGLPLFTIPDVQTAEETVHYAMLLHHNPQKVLLIGGGFSGALFEILKYPSLTSLDYVELDPEIVRIYQKYFPALWDSLQKDPRVHFHLTDGRLFLQKSHQHFDVIISALPDPFTVQLNRFFTREFFELVKRKLNPNGIFSFKISGAENFIDQNHARYIQCIHHSFQPVFKQMTFLPGSKIYFFLSNRPDSLQLTVPYLRKQLRKRSIQTKYVQPYYLTFKLMPDRLEQLRSVLQNFSFPKLNQDFKPMAYFFDMVLWTSKFSSSLSTKLSRFISFSFGKWVGLTFILSLLLLSPFFIKKRGNPSIRFYASLSMFSVGFTVISLEIILLIAFQIEYGYIYYRIALFIAFFMAGMAGGSWLASRNLNKFHVKKGLKWMLALHLIFLVLAVTLVPTVRYTGQSQILFWFLAILSGWLGGYSFPLLSQLYFENNPSAQNMGALYGWDLIGSLSGSLLSSMLLIPIYGLPATGIFLGLLNFLVFICLLVAFFRSGPIKGIASTQN